MTYILDANALLAVFYVEPGAATIHALLAEEAATFHIHALNLCEVLYGLIRGRF